MDHGRIVEQGIHQQLAVTGGRRARFRDARPGQSGRRQAASGPEQ